MFPLNWNIPFIRKNGSRTTLGAITGDIAGIEEDVSELTDKTDSLYDNMMDNGAVNVLNFNPASDTKKGYTFTNDNGIVHVTGSRTEGQTGNVDFNKTISLKAGTYKLTGCPSGGSNDTWCILLNINNSAQYVFDYGDGAEFTLDADTNIIVYCTIMSAYSGSVDMYFKPMISDPSLNLSYDDYVPYAMTNRELTTPVYFNLSVRNDRCTIDEQSNFRIGKQVYIRCKFTPIVSGTDLPILTIPEGYRPKALGSNDVGVALNLVPKYNNADRTNFMWALAFATGEVDCLTLSQNNAYLLCGTYFLE